MTPWAQRMKQKADLEDSEIGDLSYQEMVMSAELTDTLLFCSDKFRALSLAFPLAAEGCSDS